MCTDISFCSEAIWDVCDNCRRNHKNIDTGKLQWASFIQPDIHIGPEEFVCNDFYSINGL